MKIKKYCPTCKAERAIDIYDVLSKGKRRVLCGHCSTVLITEGEIDNYYNRYYGE